MAFEPFSLSTRKTKASLLVFSVVSIAIVHFNITLVNVPGIGFEVPVPDGLLNFVVGVANAYLLFAFILYCIDDLTYMSRPESLQERSKALVTESQELSQKVRDLEREIQKDSVLDGLKISKSKSSSRASQSTTELTYPRLGTLGVSGSSESSSELIERTGRLALLEEYRQKLFEYNSELQKINLTKATWIRIVGFDVMLPIAVGSTATYLIWAPTILSLV